MNDIYVYAPNPRVMQWPEVWVRRAGIAAGVLTLFNLLAGLSSGTQRSPGRKRGIVFGILQRAPLYPVLGVAYLALCYHLWRPLGGRLSRARQRIALILGVLLYFGGLGLVLWAREALGRMYFGSTSFGAQLFADHTLVTRGPYAIIRHPMYLGMLLIGSGGLLLYQTWTFVFILSHFPALVVRARREEQVLAEEFGPEWDNYYRCVSAWHPRLARSWSKLRTENVL